MTIAALRKHEPVDGFFDMEEDGDTTEAIARAALAARRSDATLDRIDQAAPDGVYALSHRDARGMNMALDLPEQPVYDWTDVFEDDE